ncbi:MAG: hypothetical protein MUC91_01195, partial [Verrucomicrobia bacterium]|nr:hypothetical protein [Verrucomicrobiota bacterium]
MDTNPPTEPSSPPAPLAPPPIISPAPTGPGKRRGRGWMVTALILLLFLVVSVIANFGLLIGAAFPMQSGISGGAGPRLQEVTVEDRDARKKIAIIEVEGIIAGQLLDGHHNMVDVIGAKLERAGHDDHVAAVLLKVDSPGG